MSLKIRLARGGAKKKPYYSIVIADSRSPRDGRFIEKIGTHNPILPSTDPNRVVLNAEKAKEWLAKGALPTDRVARFLEQAGLRDRPARQNPKKAEPGKKMQERAKERADKAEALAAAAAAPPPPAPAPEPESAAEGEGA